MNVSFILFGALLHMKTEINESKKAIKTSIDFIIKKLSRNGN